MKILAIIPARGGSKRLPGKNIKLLGGIPLINWTINSVKALEDVCDILVSTDDADIAGIAKEAGAFVPWLRPEALSTDTATSVDVALHALTWYEAHKGTVDGILLLQPTSPFRTEQSIINAIKLFKQCDMRQVVSVSPASEHPMWCMKIENDCLVPFAVDHGKDLRSQDLGPAYVLNGCVYLTTPDDLKNHQSFVMENAVPLIIESDEERLDIDTAWDWRIAEYVVSICD